MVAKSGKTGAGATRTSGNGTRLGRVEKHRREVEMAEWRAHMYGLEYARRELNRLLARSDIADDDVEECGEKACDLVSEAYQSVLDLDGPLVFANLVDNLAGTAVCAAVCARLRAFAAAQRAAFDARRVDKQQRVD